MYKQLFTIILALTSLLPMSLKAQTAEAQTAEAYAALNEDKDNTTLTFYYDTQKEERGGFGIGPFTSTTDRGWHSDREIITTVVFHDSFASYDALTSMSMWFYGLKNMTAITGISNLNTANVTSMRSTFSGCSSLTSLDLSSLNTSKVTDMSFMLEGCSSLTELNVGFSTESVTTMANMFLGCSSLTTLDLSTFNTASVKSNMDYMFSSCTALTTIYVSDLWTTVNVTSGNEMFNACQSLVGGAGTTFSTSHRGLDYAHIDGGATNPGYLTDINSPTSYPITIKVVGFGSVTAARTTVVSGDEQNIDVMPGTSLIMAFTPSDGYRLGTVMVDTTNVTSQVIADSTGVSYYTLTGIYDAHSVTATFVNDTKEAYAVLSENNTILTFYYDNQKEAKNGMSVGPFSGYPDFQTWYSNRATITTVIFDESFSNCTSLTNTDYWFYEMEALTAIEGISNLKTDNVTDMVGMFWRCSGLTSLDLRSFNTSNLTSMSSMFRECPNLTSLDLSGFKTDNVTMMFGLFDGCSSLTSLDLSSFKTDNLTEMAFMFSGCSALTSLNLSSFNTSSVTDMRQVFEGCSGLKTIYAGSAWSTAAVTEGDRMFNGCTSLVGGAGTTYDANHTDHTYAHIDGGTANPGYFTDINSIEVVGNTDLSSAWWTAFSSNYEIPANYTLHMQFTNHSDKANNWDNWVMLCTADSTRTPEYFALRADRYGWGDYHNADGFTTNWEDWDAFREAMDGALVDLTVCRWGSEVKVTSISKATDGTEYIQTYTTAVDTAAAKSVNVFFTVENAYLEIYKNSISLTPTEAPAEPEPYAVLSDDNTVLTFYYDNQKEARGGMDVGPFGSDEYREWSDSRETITRVVFDESFANVSTINSTDYWFYGMKNLTIIEGLPYLNTSNVTSMRDMFSQCASLTSLDVSNFNTSKVTNMYGLFAYCSSLTSLDLTNFNTDNVTDMGYMFPFCSSLTSLDVSSFNTANVTNMFDMFGGCSSLTTLDLTNFNTERVTNMEYMFYNCHSLTSLDVSNFNTASVTNMAHMFAACNLTVLDLSSFNTSSVTDMSQMFFSSYELTTIYAGNDWTTEAVTDGTYMFSNCSLLIGGQGTSYSDDHTDHTYAHIDGGESNPGYFTDKNAPAPVVKPSVPEFAFEGDNLTMTTQTEGASIFYAMADLPSTDDEALVDSVTNSFTVKVGADDGNFYYEQPFELKKTVVLKAIAVGNGTDGQEAVSDTTVLVYDYETWTILIHTVAQAQDVYGRAEGNSKVDQTLVEELKGIIDECTMIYYHRANIPYFEAKHFTMRLVELMGKIEDQMSSQDKIIQFADASVKAICVQKWDTNGDGELSQSEAAAVTGLEGVFSNNQEITSFDEFQYFTSVTAVGGGEFTLCSNLKSIVFPASVTTIGSQAFQETGFTEFTIPNTVTTIEAYAFSGNIKLKSIVIPASVTSIGVNAFLIYALEQIEVDSNNTVYDSRDNCNAIVETATNKLVQACKTSTIPSSIEAIGEYAFYWIEWTSVTIPASVKSIEEYAFNSSFYTSEAPKEIICEVETLFEINSNVFYDEDYKVATLYVPESSIEAYRNTPAWSQFQNIKAIGGSEPTFAFDAETGVLTVGGETPMADALEGVGGLVEVAKGITAVVWQNTTPLTNSDLQGLDNPNMLVYVNADSLAPQNRDNVVVNGFAKNIVLTDVSEGNGNFYAPQEFTAEMITYTRNFQQHTEVGVSRGWETIALPFAVQTVVNENNGVIAPFGSSASNKHFWLRQLSQTGLTAAVQIEANTPYLISMPNSDEYPAEFNQNGRVTFSSENVVVPATFIEESFCIDTVHGGEIIFLPTMKYLAQAPDFYALNVGAPQGEYAEGSVFVLNSRDIRPFEAYTMHHGNQPAPQYLPVMGMSGGNTTGIEDVRWQMSDGREGDHWYDLNGRRLQGRPTAKGVYILNGRKTVVK